jgi:hypothetical protein
LKTQRFGVGFLYGMPLLIDFFVKLWYDFKKAGGKTWGVVIYLADWEAL